jgi:glycerophosphoryl diester phosphodiesterase
MCPGSLAIEGQGGPDAAPLVVAHRGAWRAAPQNSLEAFEDAIHLGCDAIELDVRRTLDGRVVVVHDARAGVRPIAKITHEELQGRARHRHAPALEEVLDRFAGRIGIDVELKEDGYVEQAMAIVKRRLAPEQYVVTSFQDSVLPTVKRIVPEARAGLLLGPTRQISQLPRRLASAEVDFLAPHLRLARAGLLTWAARRELPCWVWTVNERRALRLVSLDARVAAVITDRPDRALDAREARDAAGAHEHPGRRRAA